jgi:hypothetical protein
VNVEKAVLAWASDLAEGDEEFLVAFKIDGAHFRVIRAAGGATETQVFTVATPTPCN